MLIKNIGMLLFLSILATVLLWLFNADPFAHCYIPYRAAIGTSFIYTPVLSTCIFISALIVIGILILLPAAITLIAVFGYWVIYRQLLSYRYYLLWIAWLGALYYVTFNLTFLES